jgi:hypothetical protein
MRSYVALVLAVGLFIGSCGGDDDGATATTTTTPDEVTTTTEGAGLTGEEAEVAAAWEAFFDLDSTLEESAARLESGIEMREAIEAAAGQETRVTASVDSVRIVGDVAEVSYSIDAENGDPLLPDARGVAVKVDGEWKVSDGSFCTLLGLGQIVTQACEGKIEPDVPPAA